MRPWRPPTAYACGFSSSTTTNRSFPDIARTRRRTPTWAETSRQTPRTKRASPAVRAIAASVAAHAAIGSTCRHATAETLPSLARYGTRAAPVRAIMPTVPSMPAALVTAAALSTQTPVLGGSVRAIHGADRATTTPRNSPRYTQNATSALLQVAHQRLEKRLLLARQLIDEPSQHCLAITAADQQRVHLLGGVRGRVHRGRVKVATSSGAADHQALGAEPGQDRGDRAVGEIAAELGLHHSGR